jgi:tetratricopeptide (TPR) repeat protein
MFVYSSIFLNNLIYFIKNKKFIVLISAFFVIILLSYDILGIKKANRGDFHFALGTAYMTKGMINEAEKAFSTSLSLNPNKKNAHLNLGIIHYMKKDFEAALKEFENEARIVDGEKSKAYSNIGVLYRLKGDMDKAISYGEKAILSGGDLNEAFYNLSISYQNNSDYYKSIEILRKGLSFYPSDIRLLFNLGLSYEKSFSSDSAIFYYSEAIRNKDLVFIENYDFGCNLQNRWGLSGKDDNVIALSHLNLATLIATKKNHEFTKDKILDTLLIHIEEALRLNPNLPEAHLALGNIQISQNNPQMALSSYRQAKNMGLTGYVLDFNTARAEYMTGNTNEAIIYLERVLSEKPDFEPAKNMLLILSSEN